LIIGVQIKGLKSGQVKVDIASTALSVSATLLVSSASNQIPYSLE